ncbi:hypothetical protein [Streptosporangium sp. KLBMP 9127]|nr:hypothetical protein [Streptosporangium sp. KLBMP 9127]MCG5220799.1 hypothetical protein [Streptosporangium sp. KLBMP 9127]
MAITFLALAFVTVAGAPAAVAEREQRGAGSASSALPAKGARVHPCFDGRCKITVSRPVSFRIDSRYGFSRLSIAKVGSGSVRVRGTGSGVFNEVVLGPGANGTVNDLAVRVSSVTRQTATVHLAPVR